MRKLLMITAVVCAALLMASPVGADAEEDQAIADEVVAGTADVVPDGWEEDPPADDEGSDDEGSDDEGSDDDGSGLDVPECDELSQKEDEAQEENPFAKIAYSDAADAARTEVASAVYIFPKARAAKRFANLLNSEETLACAEAAGELFPGASVEVGELELNNAAGFRLTVDAEGEVFVTESLRVRVGRAVLTVNASSQGEPLPFVEDTITTLEENLKDAL